MTWILVTSRGQTFELQGVAIIGRSPSAHVTLNDSMVSRRHAELHPQRDAVLVKDLNSQNGTFVNGIPITASHPLRPGERLTIGRSTFILQQSAEPQGRWQLITTGGKAFWLPRVAIIGRAPSADIVLSDGGVSRNHAELRSEHDAVTVRDLGSRNGTFVNGSRIWAPHRLRSGDRLQLGNTVLALRAARPAHQSHPRSRAAKSQPEEKTRWMLAAAAVLVLLVFLAIAVVAFSGGEPPVSNVQVSGITQPQRTRYDYRLIPVAFREGPLDEERWQFLEDRSGWKEIQFKLVVENHSPAWTEESLFLRDAWEDARISTAEGFEYPLGDICQASFWNIVGGYVHLQGSDFVPSGFRQATAQSLCRVAEGSSGYRLTLPYQLGHISDEEGPFAPFSVQWEYVYEGMFDVQLENSTAGLPVPLMDSWDAYRQNPPAGLTAVSPGEELGTPFGSISFDRVRVPEGPWPYMELIVTVDNNSPGQELHVSLPGSVYTSWEETSGLLQSGVTVGPGQEKTATVRTNILDHERFRKGQMPDSVCVVMSGFEYNLGGSGDKQWSEMPVVVCFEP